MAEQEKPVALNLRVNCLEINQITSKCQVEFFGQNLQKKV